ncbi:MAG: hypothetical protein JJE51_14975 [Thermoanaerobaculia bacterium]|nr:hypothetical protein [Thermoanaerobaculia bacterium]
MNKVTVRAPVRADLAGGTLDLWPLYLFHPGSRTVNVAISFYAESEVVRAGDGAIEMFLTDQQYRQRYESMQELSADPKAALIYRAVEHFHLSGISITTRTDAPRGSGLGGSSALSITLVRALSEIAGAPVEGEALIALVRDLETRLLGVPAGIQDYYPPVYGGLASLHLLPGAPVRHPIATPVADLAQHMLLHYTGVSHFSGTNNWELYKRQIDGKKKVQKGLSKIAATSIEMEKALEAGDFKTAGAVLGTEWRHRKELIEGISTPEIDAAVEAALGAGAWGGKVCGAGGGGCIVFLFPPENRAAIVEALASVPGRVLDVAPVSNGLSIQRDENAKPMADLPRGRMSSRVSADIEQRFSYAGSGDYRPYLMAEAIVTRVDSRSGTHHAVTRAYAAPVLKNSESAVWLDAKRVDPDKLDLRAVPDPERGLDRSVPVETLAMTAAGSEGSFREFLESSERLRIYQNGAFGLYSEPNESRESFIARCIEEAQRRVDDQTERLESTFRRRLDQLRERSEREDRQRDSDEAIPLEHAQDVNVSWGQELYNITSGRTSTATEAPQSVREVDYRDHISLIQKSWDRELQALRDDLIGKANEIEELSVAPAPKNIEITKFVIVWM